MTTPIDLDHHDSMLPAAVKWIEPTTRQLADRLLDQAALPTGTRILDVGAGTGPLVAAAAARGLEVVGIDIAPLTTTYLAGRVAALPLASAALADATALPHATDSFDAAFSVLAAMYAGPAALTEMHRVVRPGGTVAIVHWARSYMSPHTRIIWETSPDLAVDLPALTPDDFTAALATAGFADIRVEPITADYALPAADDFLLEFAPFIVTHPVYRAMSPHRRADLDTALAARVRRIETGEEARPPFEAHVAWATVR